MNGELLKAITFFTRETRIMDALAVCCGKGKETARAWDGRDAGENTLFDLASATKIFTGLCLMRLWETGELDPFRPVRRYCPEFENLGDITVEQLMAFQVQLRTPERIDRQTDREAALRCLRQVGPAEKRGPRDYSDIPAMALKYVIEQVAGMPMYACVRQLVLEPAGMDSTFAKVPAERVGDCLLYGPEYRIQGTEWICRTDPRRGVPHDPKAAILQGDTEDLCGHAGLFSTLGDMEKLARALLAGRIISPESMARMAENRTGHPLPGGGYTQYLGYCCYRKHPDQYFSEIPAAMSQQAFGMGGFTGNHFSVDPGTGSWNVFLGNRVRERLTVLIPEEGKTRTDYGLHADGTGTLCWRDGTVLPSSVDYVHQKDEHLHAVIAGLWAEGRGGGGNPD